MKLNRFLIVIIIIAVFAMLYAFLNVNGVFASGYSFQQGFSELNQIWLKQNIDPAKLDKTDISQISLTQLNSIESGINQFQSNLPQTDDHAVLEIKNISSIHLSLVSLLKEKKKLNGKILLLSQQNSFSQEKICSKLQELKPLIVDSQSVSEKANLLEQTIIAFEALYPGVVANSYLDALKPNASAVNQHFFETAISIDQLERLC